MRARTWTARLCMLLVMLALLSVGACAKSHSLTPSAPSPSPSASDAPARAEIVRAIKTLTGKRYTKWYQGIAVLKLEQDASGRWLASAELLPPPMMSYWPSRVVIVKNPDGWQIVSLKVDRTGQGLSSPSPPVQAQ